MVLYGSTWPTQHHREGRLRLMYRYEFLAFIAKPTNFSAYPKNVEMHNNITHGYKNDDNSLLFLTHIH